MPNLSDNRGYQRKILLRINDPFTAGSVFSHHCNYETAIDDTSLSASSGIMSSHGNITPKSTTSAAAPPSLNVYKKVAVIRKPSDSLTYFDPEGNVKSVSAEQLGDAISHAVSKANA